MKEAIFDRIVSTVCDEMDLTKDEIFSKSHRQIVVDARHIIMYMLKAKGFYCENIATLFSANKRYTYMIISNFENRLKQSREIQFIYAQVKRKVDGN